MIISFYKYQGTGNDFIIIDDRDNAIELTKTVIGKLANRKFGIGADGVILIRDHDEFDFEMIFYNPDGTQSFCGNGSRCAVLFAYHMGMVGKQVKFLSTDGIHKAIVISDSLVEIDMIGNIKVENLGDGSAFSNTGSPHYVQYKDNLDELDFIDLARNIRYSDAYKLNGVNVNFIHSQNDGLFVRTYERGVEAETLSCGTGVTAAALVHSIETKINNWRN
ncbi:MAG: diaminopimelate epimerase [Parvicellaceae bacterium]